MLSKARAKYIQSLAHKKHRDEEDLFIAEGPKIVGELLLEQKKQVTEIYATEEWYQEHGVSLPNASLVTGDELKKISQLQTPNQVLALVKKFEQKTPALSAQSWVLALDGIQDPGNLGTIIRIADWFGITDIVCDTGCADSYNPKVVQATMGSIARVNVYYKELAEWLSQQCNSPVYGALLEGIDITSQQNFTPGILVIGNESKGIGADVLEKITIKITIPQKGKAESLNAAVATGIILSHLV